ncbi:hypothetical protein KW479_00695 [Vibrio fluvialis]|nr:hypothetical protein [Vibrio fluvialis]
MDLVFSIAKPIKAAWNMLRSLFRGYEIRDKKAMSLELKRAELVNDGTSIRLTVKICNHGLTELTVNHIKPRINVEGYSYHFNTIICGTTLKPEDHHGQLVELMLPVPFLLSDFTVTQLNRQANCDLYNHEHAITGNVDELNVNISRGFSSNCLNFSLYGRTDWQFKLDGLHHYLKKAA